jgi:hypothetical protein
MPRYQHQYSNGRSPGKDMNWVSPEHDASATPSRFAVNARRGNTAPPRIVAQHVAGKQGARAAFGHDSQRAISADFGEVQ